MNRVSERPGNSSARLLAVAVAAIALATLVVVASLTGTQTGATLTSSRTAMSSESTVTLILEPFEIQGMTCPSGCSIYVPWGEEQYPPYRTLMSLVNASWFVFVGNVTAKWTVAVGTVPVSLYNVTSITVLKTPTPAHPYIPQFGGYIQVGEVGGTAASSTMSLQGYPDLTVGGTYVFFLSPSFGASPDAPFAYEIGHSLDHSFPSVVEMTQGGPQGLFYVRGGMVYSLDNMYPQADSWIPTKAAGVPLAQFVQEIQSAVNATQTISAP